MGYFSQFPTFLAKISDRQKVVEDFFIRVAAGKNYTSSSVLLLSTYVMDGERPEDVSYRFYGAADYHWVVLLVNNIVDPRIEWPFRDADVSTYTLRKYGSLTDNHHYQTVAGKHEISGYANLLAQNIIEGVSNFDYELSINEARRSIKILDPQYLNEFTMDLQHQVTA